MLQGTQFRFHFFDAFCLHHVPLWYLFLSLDLWNHFHELFLYIVSARHSVEHPILIFTRRWLLFFYFREVWFWLLVHDVKEGVRLLKLQSFPLRRSQLLLDLLNAQLNISHLNDLICQLIQLMSIRNLPLRCALLSWTGYRLTLGEQEVL